MKFFALSFLAAKSVLSTENDISACGNDMRCVCGDNYNQYFDGNNWNDNPCNNVDLFPLDDGYCYNQKYRTSMTVGRKDPHIDQTTAFYYGNYPLISEIGAIFNPYFHDPLSLGIPCGFNLRNVARVMAGQYLGADNKAYIRSVDLRMPNLKYIPNSVFLNSHVAKIRFLFSGLEGTDSLPTGFMQDENRNDVIELGLQESHISSAQLSNSDFIGQFPQIRELNLRHNQISFLDKNWFANTPNLMDLTLANNQISSLPADLFDNTPNLELVNLNFNQISAISANSFTPVANSLSQLYLGFNQLIATDFSTGKKFTRIYLGGNDQCNFSNDDCKFNNGDIFDNIDFASVNDEFQSYLQDKIDASDNPNHQGLVEQQTYWATNNWSKYTLLWLKTIVPDFEDGKIEEFYNLVDTEVGNNCGCN